MQLKLANGDQLTGSVIKETETEIFFSSPTLGELTIPRSALAPKAPPVAKPPLVATPKPTPKSDLQGLKPKSKPWRIKVEFGFFMAKGRDNTVRHHILTQAEKTFGRNTVLAKGRIAYAKQNERNTTNQTEASVRWRENFGNGTFTQFQTSYARDLVAGIDINLEQNVGLGYRLIDHDQHTLNIGTGLTGQYRNAENIDHNTGALTEIFQDQTYKFNDIAKIVQSLTLQYWPSAPYSAASGSKEEDNIKWRFSTTLVSKLSEHLSLNLRYQYDYDNAVADPAAREDQRISSALGYVF